MMKYILHIGQSKTGTSSLQSFLAKNRKALRSQGFLFPDVLMGGANLNVTEHNALADALAGFMRYPDLTPEQYFQQFEDQAKAHQCHTIILSAESFFGAPQIWRVADEDAFWEAQKTKVQALEKFMKGKDVKIIAYLRNQSDWFESATSQIIRTEGLLGHKIYENDQQLFEFLKPHMDYQRILDIWRSEFSESAMSVIPFDKKILENKNIIDDFCKRISLEVEGFIFPTKEENVSLDRRYIWLKNKLNQRKRSKAKERLIISILTDLNRNLQKPYKYKIPSTLRTAMDDFYIPRNENLSQVYEITSPNILTSPHEAKAQEDFPIAEKEAATRSYKKALYSPKSLLLFLRYSVGALLREHAPLLNAFLKRFIK